MAPEDAPATKRDIRELEARLEVRMDSTEERLEVRMDSMEERLLERMRDMQTELLKAFLPYQEQAGL